MDKRVVARMAVSYSTYAKHVRTFKYIFEYGGKSCTIRLEPQAMISEEDVGYLIINGEFKGVFNLMDYVKERE